MTFEVSPPDPAIDGWIDTIPEAPVLRPSLEEFQNPLKYIQQIVPIGQRTGIVKIIPPEGWDGPHGMPEVKLRFPTRLQNISKLQQFRNPNKPRRSGSSTRRQASVDHVMCEVCGGGSHEEVMLLCDQCGGGHHIFCLVPPLTEVPEGDWQCTWCRQQNGEDIGFDDGKKYSLEDFTRLATLFKERYFEGREGPLTLRDVELEFWKIIDHRAREVEVLYGSDLNANTYGSGFTPCDGSENDEAKENRNMGWNLNQFARLNGSLLVGFPHDITGITVPWLYVGMIFSSFCWHNEDHFFYSISYNHTGGAKTWYGVPGSNADQFEQVMRQSFPDVFLAHPDLHYQIVTMLSPRVLMKQGVPVYRAHHMPGEFVVTFPAAYHAGFSHDVNFTEAVNFATPDWLPWGFEAVQRYRKFRRLPVFSHEELVWTCCTSNVRTQLDTQMLNFVIAEMKHIYETEKILRSRLRQAQRAGMLLVRCTAGQGVHGPTNDTLKDRNCVICNYQLFFSGLTCECSPDKIVCLNHADQLCACPAFKHCLFIRHTLQEIDQVLSQAEHEAVRPTTTIKFPRQTDNIADSYASDLPRQGTEFDTINAKMFGLLSCKRNTRKRKCEIDV